MCSIIELDDFKDLFNKYINNNNYNDNNGKQK